MSQSSVELCPPPKRIHRIVLDECEDESDGGNSPGGDDCDSVDSHPSFIADSPPSPPRIRRINAERNLYRILENEQERQSVYVPVP